MIIRVKKNSGRKRKNSGNPRRTGKELGNTVFVKTRFPNPPAKTFIRLAVGQGPMHLRPHARVESLLHKGG
jgi:hypothetical protein